jgi:Uma2 family endonuclease
MEYAHAASAQHLSFADYMAWESRQEGRNELLNGTITPVSGQRRVNAEVIGNIMLALHKRLDKREGRVYMAAKVVVNDSTVLYPDVFVTEDAADLRCEELFRTPTLILEVLSDETQAYKRGAKFRAYRQLPSLKEYLLVDPESRRVEVFRRNERNIFELHDHTGAAELVLTSVDLHVPMADVFEGVEPAAS